MYIITTTLCSYFLTCETPVQTCKLLRDKIYLTHPQTGTLANSGVPDEMQHNAVFHQSLYSLRK